MEKYTIISLIGEGSFGRVYKANKKLDDSVVAVKIISKRGRSNKELKNLRRECDIQSRLNHPNIILMIESFETKNDMVVVTEFALTDLHRHLAKCGTLDEEKAQTLTGHLISALYYLHSHRILHRDLKPQNILLNDNFNAKLCDFGLARNMTMGTHVLTSIKGTPLYMAPELLAEKPYDHQADLWSLGCIVYETLCGQPPFCTTSILHLVRLIRHEEVKWPSFLTSDCISLLQGLLEKDPSLRLSWAQILCHPFVEGRLVVIKEDIEPSPYINPKDKLAIKKEKLSKQVNESSQNLETDLNLMSLVSSNENLDNTNSSKDSIHAILQSDIENIDTDAEDERCTLNIPFSETPDNLDSVSFNLEKDFTVENSNLIVTHLNDNFTNLSINSVKQKKTEILNKKQTEKSNRNKDLEKRKLSQNLDNFSLRLGQSVDNEQSKRIIESDKKKSSKIYANDEKSIPDNTPPCLLPGWDSCDESQSPPIENEEWLAFLHRSMQEIFDGELDSLKQQNLVSIIVAPLRNTKASPKVVQRVAQLLSMPLVLGGPVSIIEEIKNVYIEVKLVPNLVYASKLITNSKSAMDSTSSLTPHNSNQPFRQIKELSSEEVKTLSSLYELVCHLVHLNERFLSQFCDAVAILAADDLLINLLSHDFTNTNAIRIANCVIALLCCVVRELPENAELVERVVFNKNLDIISLMKNEDILLRSRICMLLRVLGRFSCRGLQTIWTKTMRETIESLMYDSSDQVRVEAESALDELKHFSFYNID